jgi:RNA polymerase sigma factor (sigma-70 family)
MSSDPEAATASDTSVRTFRGSLDELAKRYYAPLLSFFRKRTHNAPEVQDLVQQVFLRLAQCEELDGVRNPDGYIFQTAANTLRDHYRHNAVRNRFSGEHCLGESQQAAFSPERLLEGREAMAHLAQALRQLPERTRDILMLRCFEGLKHTEIARLQGISVRSVEKHMAKALGHLSEALDKGPRE